MGKQTGNWAKGKQGFQPTSHSAGKNSPGALADEIRNAAPPTEQPLTTGMSDGQVNSVYDSFATRKEGFGAGDSVVAIEKVSESSRNLTTEDGTVIETTTTLWEDGTYTVYAEWDQDQIYQTTRWFRDPLIDNATEPPTDDDIIGAYETALGW